MIELPKAPRKATAVNPSTLIIYSTPKAGKTSIVAQLPNSLILELEKNGGNYVDGTFLDIDKASKLDEALDTIIAAGCPYDYLIIDTVSSMDSWSEIVGTYNYMSRPQGKKFNRKGDREGGEIILHTDPNFTSVHELANGSGYQHSRDQMIRWYDKIIQAAPHVIFLAHVKDKFIESKQSGDTVEATDISLTGKVKSIYTSRVDGVGHLFRRGGQAIINFNNENSITCGGRCRHLNGEIVISEKQPDGTIKTFWDRIYLPKQ